VTSLGTYLCTTRARLYLGGLLKHPLTAAHAADDWKNCFSHMNRAQEPFFFLSVLFMWEKE